MVILDVVIEAGEINHGAFFVFSFKINLSKFASLEPLIGF